MQENSDKVQYLRSVLHFGGPLNVNGIRYNDISDRSVEQQDYVISFLGEIDTFIEEKSKTTFHPQFKTYLYNIKMSLLKYQGIVQKDIMFAVFSVFFVWCYLTYHLHSIFLGIVSMSIILSSFPVTQIICEGLFKVTYFGNLHAMVIFVVLGIAADDIFVFIDGWR